MKLPIVGYGNPILRKVAQPITETYPHLQELIANMWETMYHSNGVGLAAPQINLSIRLFVVDSEQLKQSDDEDTIEKYADEQTIKETFINAEIISLAGDEWKYNEGCLSIPKVREDVMRKSSVTIRYYNAAWQLQERTFDGITARIILHEYDHIEGKLFIDYLTPLKKRLLKSKLDAIQKGKVKVDYKMMFAVKQ